MRVTETCAVNINLQNLQCKAVAYIEKHVALQGIFEPSSHTYPHNLHVFIRHKVLKNQCTDNTHQFRLCASSLLREMLLLFQPHVERLPGHSEVVKS